MKQELVISQTLPLLEKYGIATIRKNDNAVKFNSQFLDQLQNGHADEKFQSTCVIIGKILQKHHGLDPTKDSDKELITRLVFTIIWLISCEEFLKKKTTNILDYDIRLHEFDLPILSVLIDFKQEINKLDLV